MIVNEDNPVVLVLPWPISANRYWASRVIKSRATNRWMAMTYVTPEAKAYKADCQRIAQAAGIHTPIAGRVSVGLQLYPARPQDWAKRASKDPMSWDDTVRSLDLDNARKVVYDALKEVVFEDDSRVFSDWACRMEPDAHGARVLVRVASIVRANPQASLLEAMAA